MAGGPLVPAHAPSHSAHAPMSSLAAGPGGPASPTPLPPLHAPRAARADPWLSPRDTPANKAAARVLRRVMGAEPLFFKCAVGRPPAPQLPCARRTLICRCLSLGFPPRRGRTPAEKRAVDASFLTGFVGVGVAGVDVWSVSTWTRPHAPAHTQGRRHRARASILPVHHVAADDRLRLLPGGPHPRAKRAL
jgi:hypothetical protein